MFELGLMVLTLLQGPLAIDRLPRRDSLVRQLERAEDSLALLDRLRRVGEAGTDTVSAGSLRMVVRRADRVAALSVLPELARGWTSLLGDSVPAVTFQAVRRPGSFWEPGPSFALRMYLAGDSAVVATAPLQPTRLGRLEAGRLREAAWSAIGSALFGLADPRLRAWLGAPASPVPWSYETDDLHDQVATTRSPTARACFDGELSACPDAFGLAGPAGATTLQIRQSLLAQALSVGAPGSWRRLTAEPEAPIARRLEAAAGQPIDSLFQGWQRWRIAHRPTAMAAEIGRWVAAGAWLVLGLVAVGGWGGRR